MRVATITMADDANNLYDDAIIALLRLIPERWEEFEFDRLTSIESRALFFIVAAGMVERRLRFRARMANHSVAGEATIECTGEYGFVEAMKPFLASMWEDWKDAYADFTSGERKNEPSSICERLRPDEWRLTDQGVLARIDLDNGMRETVLEFVLHRGFFDGTPKLLDGRIVGDSHVRGGGILVSMQKVPVSPIIPAEVIVKNWTEGAEAIAAALHSKLKPIGTDEDGAERPGIQPEIRPMGNGKRTRRQRRARWLAEAMLLVQDHPDWPDRRIADAVSIDPGTLSRAKEYQAAAALARGEKGNATRGHITTNPDTGQSDVEAYADDDDSDRLDE